MAGCLKFALVTGLCLIIGVLGLSMMSVKREVDESVPNAAEKEAAKPLQQTSVGQQAPAREQLEVKEAYELAVGIRHLNTKLVDGKERYFFRFSNHADVPFEGSITVELVGVNGKTIKSERFTTTVACPPGWVHAYYVDNEPLESAGYQVGSFKYLVKGSRGGVQHGTTTKPDPNSAAGRSQKAAENAQEMKAKVAAVKAAREQDPAFRENKAASKVKMAKSLLNEKDNSVPKKRLQEVVDDYPETEAAKEAEGLLEKL
jgi:hypothetical protein